MKNLFIGRLIEIFLFASLVHIDMVNVQDDAMFHQTPQNIDRQELDKKLAELGTMQLKKGFMQITLYLKLVVKNSLLILERKTVSVKDLRKL